ncbi:MAG: MFS transporter [Promethearchaeota archaeon]
MISKNSNKKTLLICYFLSTIGDLNYSLLLTASVLYGSLLNATKTEIGLIGGAYGISYVIMTPLLGKFGDKTSRKLSIMIALFGQVLISIFLLFLAESVFNLILGQILLGILYAFYWPGIESIISELKHDSQDEHQKAMANFCIFWSIGYMSGPFLGGIFRDIQIKYAFIIALLTYLIELCIAFFGIKFNRSNSNRIKINENEKFGKGNTAQSAKRDINLIINIIFAMFLYALIVKIIVTYFADYAVTELNWSGTKTGIAMLIFGIGRTAYFILSRMLSGPSNIKSVDKFDKKISNKFAYFFRSSLSKIKFSFLIFGILLILTPIFDSFYAICIIFAIFGYTAGNNYLSSIDLFVRNEKESKGLITGLFESTIGFGAIISPLLAGIIAENNVILPFFVFGLMSLLFFFISFIFKITKNKNK